MWQPKPFLKAPIEIFLRITLNYAVFLSRFRARIIRLTLKFLDLQRNNLTRLWCGEFLGEVRSKKLAIYSTNSVFEASHGRDDTREIIAFPNRELVEVYDVNLDTKTGMIFTDKKQIVEESSSWPGAQLILNSIPFPLWPRKLKEGRVEKCILLPGNSFYHWLIEDLPPFLFALQEVQNPVVLVYSDAPSYVLQFADSLPCKVIKVPRYLSMERYLFTTKNPCSGWPEPVDVNLLREYFSKGIERLEAGKKIYISRLNSARSPSIEKVLVELLVNEGWQILYTENMDLLEQIRVISTANVVCGVGGAGLSHITWLGEGAKVIELSPNWYVPCFSRLSQVLGIEYKSIFFEQNSMTASDVYAEIDSIVNLTPKRISY